MVKGLTKGGRNKLKRALKMLVVASALKKAAMKMRLKKKVRAAVKRRKK